MLSKMKFMQVLNDTAEVAQGWMIGEEELQMVIEEYDSDGNGLFDLVSKSLSNVEIQSYEKVSF